MVKARTPKGTIVDVPKDNPGTGPATVDIDNPDIQSVMNAFHINRNRALNPDEIRELAIGNPDVAKGISELVKYGIIEFRTAEQRYRMIK